MQRKCCSHCPEVGEESTQPAQPTASCIERFATAKKFHAENLQHQPLPDRVDDAIFRATGTYGLDDPCMRDAVKRCQRIVPRRHPGHKRDGQRGKRYGPALGCKRPTTYMDLAICWETPQDPVYEPRRAPHIDGSDGGPAPSLFTFVQHPPAKVDVHNGAIALAGQDDKHAEESQPRVNEGRCRGDCEHCLKELEAKEELCKGLGSMSIAGESSRSRRDEGQRHCAGCPRPADGDNNKVVTRSPRFLSNPKRCGIGGPSPHKFQAPRPRTPYARRSFRIDSLAPPFSISSGYRDAEYPEHWRLTSVYRQSYRNPKKMREGRTLLKYDRS